MGAFDDLIPVAAAAQPPPQTGIFADLVPRTSAHVATDIGEAIRAGYQGSATGFMLRGKLPDVVLDSQHSTWLQRLASGAAGTLSEVPEMLVGGIAGAFAGGAAGSAVPGIGTAGGALVGGGAGAFALPTAIRESYVQALTKGEITSSGDFLDRAAIVLKQTGKAGIVGALTGPLGKVAGIGAKAAGFGEAAGAATLAGEYGTIVVAPAALEGHLPEPEDFLNAAIVLGGLKGAVAAAAKLRTIYAKTGVPPEQVVADASRDPAVREEIAAETPPAEVPSAYEPQRLASMLQESVPVDEIKVADVLGNMEGRIPETKTPNYPNFRYVDQPQDVQAVMARISEVFERDIAERRGTKGWEETAAEAQRAIADALGTKPDALERGNLALDAEMLAKKAMLDAAARDVWDAGRIVREKGNAATDEDFVRQIMAIEQNAMVQAHFQGDAAEVARALNVMKAAKQARELSENIAEITQKYHDPHILARMIGELENTQQLSKFARGAAKATTTAKLLEAWKASILSGPVTHMANLMGNEIFAWLRVPIDAVASAFGMARGAAGLGPAERLGALEPLGRAAGLIQGSLDGAKVSAAVIRLDTALRALGAEDAAQAITEAGAKADVTNKAEGRAAIEGVKGQVIRVPFKLLQAEDAFYVTRNERAELKQLAMRKAGEEDLNPLTREYRERVSELLNNPTDEMQVAAEAAGKRFTFNRELGSFGKWLMQGVAAHPALGFILPFIRTPTNIAKELIRMTPFAPILSEWRADFAKGGIASDRALAEMTAGSGLAAWVFMKALDGSITGANEPDRGKANVQRAAGWQPYSIVVDDKYYSVQRLQPLGTLFGLAADMAQAWDKFGDDEKDQGVKMLATAFANAITNQTFLQGITNTVRAISEPGRFAPNMARQYAGSVIPALVAQPTAAADKFERETNSMVDAIRARLPMSVGFGQRSDLLTKKDVFGEPVEAKEQLGGMSPVKVSEESRDKVRAEALRLNVSVENAPKKTHVGRGSGKLGDVELTPQERDVFATVGGKLAHQILAGIVSDSSWDNTPDLIQKKIFQRVFTQAHRYAASQAIPPEKRAAYVQQVTEKLQQELE